MSFYRTTMSLGKFPNRLVRLGLGALLLTNLVAQAKKNVLVDFNGEYKLSSVDGSVRKVPQEILLVIQTADSITATWTVEGKSSTETYDLRGRQTRRISKTGTEIRDHAKLGPKGLEIDSATEVRGITFNLKQMWTMSRDGKTMKIQFHTDIPFSVGGISSSIDGRTISEYSRANKSSN
jgi:hypothetical protein